MKIRLICLTLLMVVFSSYGCSLFIPNHESKTEAEFYADKEECDKKAWKHTRALNIIGSQDKAAIEHTNYSRKCLKEKGWYYFK